MGRSFRFEPPEVSSDALVRPRLVGALAGRWQHRLTVVAGGAGLGKTTLLVQAMAENRLAPRGEDLWIGIENGDADGDALARAVAMAVSTLVPGQDRAGLTVGLDDDAAPDVAKVADAVWRCAPVEVCLVLDDVQRVPAESPAARWLTGLIEAMPINGHVVLATREAEPPLPIARLVARRQVFRMGEAELLLTPGELAQFAAARGCDAADLAETGGWPALAELTATVGRKVAGDFLWQEVLAPIDADGRTVLAVLCDLGGGDDDLVSAALGSSVDVEAALRAVPLVAHRGDGWFEPHALWRTASDLELPEPEQLEVRRRAVVRLSERQRFDEAFDLLQASALWDLAPTVLRAACLASDHRRLRRLGTWLAACPDAVRTTPSGRLALGVHLAFTLPEEAILPLRAAAVECRFVEDVDGELCAVAQLGRLAWFNQDPSLIGPGMAMRIVELAAAGHPHAQALAAFGRATVADVHGDDASVLSELGVIETGLLSPGWEVMACWLCGVVRLGVGDAEIVCELIDGLYATAEPGLRVVLDGLRLRAKWALGHVDEVLAKAPASIDAIRTAGISSWRHLVLTNSSVLFSYTGDVDEARRCLDEGTFAVPRRSPDDPLVRTALATASLQLAEGHEDRAAATLRQAIAAHGLDRAVDRRGWRHTLALSYVLVPETRSYWNDADLRGYLRTTRQLAAAVVAARAGDRKALRRLELPPTGMIRSALHFRLGAELAAGLAAVGRPEGAALLEALGPPGREALRTLTAGQPTAAKPARALLAALPTPPPTTTHLAVFGGPTLRHGEETTPSTPAELRRRRVQELLAFLVTRRATTRSAINAALWPDLSETTPGNNVAVTLSHLLRALEPWREPGEPSYLIRTEGQNVRLVTGDVFRIDIDELDAHVAAAARAEAEGMPSAALEHHLAATELYRGDLFADLVDATWLALDRERYRTRFVAAATRAAQLLATRGPTDQAEDLARRALTIDPWAEGAHAALASAALARGDRTTAHRYLRRALDVLAELGIEPSDTTRQLERRIHEHQLETQ